MCNLVNIYLILTYLVSFKSLIIVCSTGRIYHQTPHRVPFLLLGSHLFKKKNNNHNFVQELDIQTCYSLLCGNTTILGLVSSFCDNPYNPTCDMQLVTCDLQHA